MTKIKQSENLDSILDDYALASQEFSAEVLKSFIEKYPEHARALQRYAQVQLTSVPATSEEIMNEPLDEGEMLPRQSKLLQRMHELRDNASEQGVSEVAGKLAAISGEKALMEATIAVFGSCDHGEDLLLLSILGSGSEVRGVPDWFYDGLGRHVRADPSLLRASNESNWRKTVGQRYSAKEKPTESLPLTWEEAIEECITDDMAKKAILEHFIG